MDNPMKYRIISWRVGTPHEVHTVEEWIEGMDLPFDCDLSLQGFSSRWAPWNPIFYLNRFHTPKDADDAYTSYLNSKFDDEKPDAVQERIWARYENIE